MKVQLEKMSLGVGGGEGTEEGVFRRPGLHWFSAAEAVKT